MDSNSRREKIKEIIQRQEKPISASRLSEMLKVSRQVIVGDVAFLRASGCSIVATARGYITFDVNQPGRFAGKIVCQHSAEDTVKELYAIIDLGGEVINVIVEHFLYGEITGQLNLSSRADADYFIKKLNESGAGLLSGLTGGVHLHTVFCKDSDNFEQIKQSLSELGVLYRQ